MDIILIQNDDKHIYLFKSTKSWVGHNMLGEEGKEKVKVEVEEGRIGDGEEPNWTCVAKEKKT